MVELEKTVEVPKCIKRSSGWEQPLSIKTFSAAENRFVTIGRTMKHSDKDIPCTFICDSGTEVSILPWRMAMQTGISNVTGNTSGTGVVCINLSGGKLARKVVT